MKLIGKFWGTSDAQGLPAPFCRCDVCNEARQKGGKYVRTRSCFRLTDKIMLDLGADAVCQSMKYGDISCIDHVLITHTHDDHLNAHMLMEAMWGNKYRGTLNYYFTDKAFDIVEHWRESPWVLKGSLPVWEENGYVKFHRLEYGKRYEIDGIGVTPFRGKHKGNVGENSALYLLELRNGKTLFYGLDSCSYFHETMEALKDRKIDIFISEATSGIKMPGVFGQHMSLDDVYKLVNELYAQGTLTNTSQVYLTHINHYSSHDDMTEYVKTHDFPVPVTVAFDGLEIF